MLWAPVSLALLPPRHARALGHQTKYQRAIRNAPLGGIACNAAQHPCSGEWSLAPCGCGRLGSAARHLVPGSRGVKPGPQGMKADGRPEYTVCAWFEFMNTSVAQDIATPAPSPSRPSTAGLALCLLASEGIEEGCCRRSSQSHLAIGQGESWRARPLSLASRRTLAGIRVL